MRERWYLITNKANAVVRRQRHSRKRLAAKDRNYFLAPDPALSILLLDEPDFILPVDAPVVVPFFMFVCLVMLLVVLLVAPGPTFPSLDAPGAG